jgi:Mg2+-importing ATPase
MGYWAKGAQELIKELASSEQGLTEEEAKARLAQYGLNDIPVRQEKTALSLLFDQVKDLLVITLIVASVVSSITGGESEALIIAAIVLANIFVGFFQEYKSEKSLQQLIKYIRYRTKVLRNGKLAEVDTRYIVPGDLVLLETGDRVPADLRLIEESGLEVDESIVTGEAFPVQKNAAPIVAEKLEPQKMENVAFMGTLVVNGKAKGIVVATGMKSSFGGVVGFMKSEEPETNYQRNIKGFSRFLIKAITVGIVFIFVVNSAKGLLTGTFTVERIISSALFSLALAVGIIPESLPIIITIGLSRGAVRMSRKGVIVKKLSAIEDLGNMDIFCSDKTGTITENKITLADYVGLNGKRDDELIRQSSICVSVVAVGGELEGTLSGSPIDVGIVEYARKEHVERPECDVVELIPFDYTRRRMSVIVRDRDNQLQLLCKGAPESLFQVCSKMKVDGGTAPFDAPRAQAIVNGFFSSGYRAIGVATKLVEEKKDFNKEEETDLTLIGFLLFKDPLKTTSRQSIEQLKKLGVQVKILTGDNPVVTKTITDDVGLETDRIIIGTDVDGMDDQALQQAAEKTNVFARLTPEHKARIVSVLSKSGHVTGFLGDGVNDAPALRFADVGISVEGGVDIAKDAADIILTQPSLEIISEGIIEGRTTFSNTTKYILNTISANMGNMATLAIISVVLDFLPMLPFQVLLTNLISDGPLLSISTDGVDVEELQKPRNWDLSLISRFGRFFGSISSIYDFITFAVVLFLAHDNIPLFRTCWVVESTLSEIIVTFAIRTKKPFYRSMPSRILALSSLIFGLLTVVLPYSPLSTFLDFYPPSPLFLIVIGCILLMYFLTAEFAKRIFNRNLPQQPSV